VYKPSVMMERTTQTIRYCFLVTIPITWFSKL
jgi:hypothetical protein